MDAFQLSQLVAERQRSGDRYLEFFRAPTLRVGIYELQAGAIDAQQPHKEDEIYYVANGRGEIRVGDEDRPVLPGSIVFVAAEVDHRFHSIPEDLTILVVFASPLGSPV